MSFSLQSSSLLTPTVSRASDPGLPLQGKITIFELPVTALPPPVTREGRLPKPDLSPCYRNQKKSLPSLSGRRYHRYGVGLEGGGIGLGGGGTGVEGGDIGMA